jgi:hypothetical protein
MSSRAALDLVGWNPQTPIKQAVEYCKLNLLFNFIDGCRNIDFPPQIVLIGSLQKTLM